MYVILMNIPENDKISNDLCGQYLKNQLNSDKK